MDGQAGAELVAMTDLAFEGHTRAARGSPLQLTTVWFLAKLAELQLFFNHLLLLKYK